VILLVDATLPLPAYEQIRQQVVRMVTAGTLLPGTRMPTIRQLASDLQLAKGTVAKAYAVLEEAQVLETRGHRGSFVLPPPKITSDVPSTVSEMLGESANSYVVAARQLGVDLASAIEQLDRCWNRF